jgi:hypothetical protein
MKCTQAEQLASGNWQLAKTKTNGKTLPRITRMGADLFLSFCGSRFLLPEPARNFAMGRR